MGLDQLISSSENAASEICFCCASDAQYGRIDRSTMYGQRRQKSKRSGCAWHPFLWFTCWPRSVYYIASGRSPVTPWIHGSGYGHVPRQRACFPTVTAR